MDLDNHVASQTYIQLLADTLRKKLEVMNQLMELTTRQETEISSDAFREDYFLELISLKEEQINKLNMLDDGFELLYEKVRDILAANQGSYTKVIEQMKENITGITDLSVKLQTMEKRNKAKLEVLLSVKRRNIRKSKLSAETAASYYKSMSMQQDAQSYFYDKKN